MEASQVKISPENLRFKPMTHKKRLQLRRENMKALIRSKPAGTVIQMKEFAIAAATNEQLAYSMLKTLIKRGEIAKIPSEGHKQRFSYAVTDGTVVKRLRNIALPDYRAPAHKLPTVNLLIEKAKEYAWEQDSDSLRGFIKWIERKNV